MAWAYCKNGWQKDSKEVTGRKIRRREKKGGPRLRWMADVKMDLRKMVNKSF
jgi:hypothetical protein